MKENISLTYYNNEGKMVEYLVAYQGKEPKSGEECIYVSDIAVIPEYQVQVGGGTLLAWI